MLEEQLQLLGFSDKEIKVYLTLHQMGVSPASVLARITSIKRTSVYDVINSLLEKNVITSFKQGQYTYYAIDDIRKLYLREKEKLNIAVDLVKSLKESQRYSPGIQIHHYIGEEGFREMYEDILNSETDEFCIWANYEQFLKVVSPEIDDEWTARRVKKKIKARVLMQSSQRGLNFQKDDFKNFRQTMLLPVNFQFETTCILYKNHIALFDPTNKMTGIRIYNPALFQMQKQIFEINWQLVQPKTNT